MKKKRARKGKTMPEHDRRNLELLHRSYLHAMLMIASVALIAAVVGGVAFWQIRGWKGEVVLAGVTILDLVLVGVMFCFFMTTRKIRRVLGTGETAKKYDVCLKVGIRAFLVALSNFKRSGSDKRREN